MIRETCLRSAAVKICHLLVHCRLLLSWCGKLSVRTHRHQYLLQHVFMLTPPPVILGGVDRQSSMVTFTRNQPDERLDAHYPLPSASRSRSDRPPWISHPPQSTHLPLFTWIKFAWPFLRFKDGLQIIVKNQNKLCGCFMLVKITVLVCSSGVNGLFTGLCWNDV